MVEYDKETIKKAMCLLVDALDEKNANEVFRRVCYEGS